MKLLLTKEDIHNEFGISFNMIDRLTKMGILYRHPDINKYHKEQIEQSLRKEFNVQPDPEHSGVAGKLIKEFQGEQS